MDNLYDSLLELAQRRSSCRHFLPDPVSDDDIDRILAVASEAPFASGRSHWKVAVIRDTGTIAALAAQVRQSAGALADGMDETGAPLCPELHIL